MTISNEDDVCQKFPIPDERVEALTLHGYLDSSKFIDLKLNELFPRLQKLILDSFKVSDKFVLDMHFPHLEYLKMRFPSARFSEFKSIDEFEGTKPALTKFLKRNPQIKDVEMIYCPSDYFLIVNTILTNIHSLKTVYVE